MSAFFLASAQTALQAESWMIPPRVWKIRLSGAVPYLLMLASTRARRPAGTWV